MFTDVGFEQEPAVDGGRPAEARGTFRMRARLVLCIRRSAARCRDGAGVRQTETTGILLVPPRGELVSRRRLPRETYAAVLPGAVGLGLMGEVRLIRPFRGIAGVCICPQPAEQISASLIATVHEKPQTITTDRSSIPDAGIPHFLQRIRSAEPGVPERVR